MKKKILIYIPHDSYFYYFQYDAYKEIKKNYHLYFLLNKQTCKNDKNVLKNYNYSFFNPDQGLQKKYSRIIFLGMAYNRKISKSFTYLFRRYFPNFFDFLKRKKQKRSESEVKENIIIFYLKNFYEYFNIFNKDKFFLRRSILQLFSLPPLFKLYKSKTVDGDENDFALIKKVKKINPDLIIYPTHCFEPESITLCKVAEAIDKKTLFLIDNWDNISSKTVFFKKPNAITVWGMQARKAALNLQSMKNSQVHHLGNPKFANYFKIRDTKHKSPYLFPYVLFLGSLQPYDEMVPLRILDDEIEKNKLKYKNLKVIYRPHPGREYLIKKCKNSNFKNIIFDKQMESFVEAKKKYSINKNNYFEKLIKNSLFMVGGITTVTIETVIFGKRYLFLAHDEKNNITSPKNMYENFNHYDEILKLKLLKKCPDLNKLNSHFKYMYDLSFKKINKIENDKQISYFYDISKTNYAVELNKIVNKVI